MKFKSAGMSRVLLLCICRTTLAAATPAEPLAGAPMSQRFSPEESLASVLPDASVRLPDHTDGTNLQRRGVPIHRGVIVIDGHEYLPPFTFHHVDGRILLNGNPIYEVCGETTEARRLAAERVIAGSERSLLNELHVVVFGRRVLLHIDAATSMRLLKALRSAATPERRVMAAMTSGLRGAEDISTSVWRDALRDFESAAALPHLQSSTLHSMEMDLEMVLEPPAPGFRQEFARWSHVEYALNVSGMFLIVVAASVLVGHKPRLNKAWRLRNPDKDALRTTLQCLCLLAALGLFDLICTITSVTAASGFVELNPVAAQFIASPWQLSVFKLCATTLGITVLWKLHHYRGAQIASWWLCLICTVVTVRWVAVQSLYGS